MRARHPLNKIRDTSYYDRRDASLLLQWLFSLSFLKDGKCPYFLASFFPIKELLNSL